MNKRAVRSVIAGVAVLAFAAAALVRVSAQARERSLHVTVVDQSGNDVSGLGPSDFVIREDKSPREVLRVAPATDPMQIALLVDDSPAVDRYLRDVRTAVTAFINAIAEDTPSGGKHQIAIITLSSRPTIKSNYTSDTKALLKAADSLLPQPTTQPTLIDGIAEASEGLSKRHATRPVIVAIAPEVNDASFRLYDQVLEPLAASGATLYVFGLGANGTDQRDRSIVLDQGAKDSGGTYETLLATNGLNTRLTRLANHLTHQYLVTYAHPNSLIPPDHVTVSAAKQGLTARGTLVKAE